MTKPLHISDISKISHLEEEVQTYALVALTILDEKYGTDRDPITDLGGYVVILEKLDDIQTRRYSETRKTSQHRPHKEPTP